MAKDSSVVTIYDLKNGGKPLTAHKIDALEFLAHPSGRWSTSPDVVATENAKELDVKEDSGKTIQLKATDFKTLRAMAQKANIPDYLKMKKDELVIALEAK
jgi:Holliday junction resolvase